MSRITLLSLITYGLLICGLATMDGSFIALALPVLIYLMSAIMYRPQGLQFNVTRTISEDRTVQDAPVSVHLTIVNEANHLERVLIEDVVPQTLVVTSGTPRMFTTIPAGETVKLAYTVSGKRGSFEFDSVHIDVSDHLDLFRQHVTLSAPARLLVMPEVQRLGRVIIRPLRTRFSTGLILSRQSGSGTDFFGVRTYQPGDPLHAINWRISARHPRAMFTNEFESERVADVGLILDSRTRSNVQVKNDSLFNHAIRATSSLSEVFLNDGNRVALLIYGGPLVRTFPGYGKIQRERILCALAQAQTGDHQVFQDLSYLPTRFFPAKSQIVLISPLLVNDHVMLQRLRSFGYHVLVISPDPVAFEYTHLKTTPDTALAARIARIERTLLLRNLRRLGILVVDWQVDTPLEQKVIASLSRLPHWSRAMETFL